MIHRPLALELQNVCNSRASGFFAACLFATLQPVLLCAVSSESVTVPETIAYDND
jgi:hypothetical protein